ncbi:MAG: cysteine peptidase family C39 domain-containing protein [Deltaproteobacteria bacterium]|nr:cysteine peptidase family C39 domain-containing protein [Deltaproteobacteria bacterium]
MRKGMMGVALLAGGAFFILGGCARDAGIRGWDAATQGKEASLRPAAVATVIPQVPFLPQEEDTCGPSSLAMLLRFFGVDARTGEIVRETRTAGLRGTLITDLAAVARRRGFEAEVVNFDLERLREKIAEGIPVILLVDLGAWVYSRPHYLLAFGVTPEGVVAHSGREEGKVIPFSSLDTQWAKMRRLAIIVRRVPK